MKALLLILAAVGAFGQSARGTYAYEKETSLSSAAEKVTIQIASGSNRTARMVAATGYCSVACTLTLVRDGTAATGTAGTVIKLNSGAPSSGVSVYHTSNVGSGTTIKTYTLSAGQEIIIDLGDKGLIAGENVTLQTSTITGTARIYFQWREY